jgi:hypothetical protein
LITTKLKLALFGIAAAAAVGAYLLQHQSGVKLREGNLALHEQVGQLAALEAANQELSNQVAQLKKSAALRSSELSELLRLRGEIGRLREQASQVEKLRQENRQLLAQSASTQAPAVTRSPEAASQGDFIQADRELNLNGGLCTLHVEKRDGDLVSGVRCVLDPGKETEMVLTADTGILTTLASKQDGRAICMQLVLHNWRDKNGTHDGQATTIALRQ